MQEDATVAAIHDQARSGLDVITDGEQGRFDFNLSFYGFLQGIDLRSGTAEAVRPPGSRSAGEASDRRGLASAKGPGMCGGV